MVENLGDIIAVISLLIMAAAGVILFYNTLVTHREIYMRSREALYYRLFDEQDDEDYEERNGPYYED